MENITSPRRGRPRKVMDVPQPIEEGSRAPDYISGNGAAGESGLGAQEEPIGEAWGKLVDFLSGNKSHKTSVAMAYCPEPKNEWIDTPTGWVRVTPGETGYTLNTGETVRL